MLLMQIVKLVKLLSFVKHPRSKVKWMEFSFMFFNLGMFRCTWWFFCQFVVVFSNITLKSNGRVHSYVQECTLFFSSAISVVNLCMVHYIAIKDADT